MKFWDYFDRRDANALNFFAGAETVKKVEMTAGLRVFVVSIVSELGQESFVTWIRSVDETMPPLPRSYDMGCSSLQQSALFFAEDEAHFLAQELKREGWRSFVHCWLIESSDSESVYSKIET